MNSLSSPQPFLKVICLDLWDNVFPCGYCVCFFNDSDDNGNYYDVYDASDDADGDDVDKNNNYITKIIVVIVCYYFDYY